MLILSYMMMLGGLGTFLVLSLSLLMMVLMGGLKESSVLTACDRDRHCALAPAPPAPPKAAVFTEAADTGMQHPT